MTATVAEGLGLGMPEPAQTARPTIGDLAPSDALSIIKNGPQSFAVRKLGLLVTDGADAGLVNALVAAWKAPTRCARSSHPSTQDRRCHAFG
ncbi:hypothetical protein [Stakelama flava]|uniref:hypothetical protein n=1 Tax=Stakelama flava TaxID=2860338 RepID=UPI001FE43971|nr:hypothetical protein [Stakelama flava]